MGRWKARDVRKVKWFESWGLVNDHKQNFHSQRDTNCTLLKRLFTLKSIQIKEFECRVGQHFTPITLIHTESQGLALVKILLEILLQQLCGCICVCVFMSVCVCVSVCVVIATGMIVLRICKDETLIRGSILRALSFSFSQSDSPSLSLLPADLLVISSKGRRSLLS